MIGAGTDLRHEALRARFELPVFDDREADSAHRQIGVVDGDASFDGSRIVGVRKVARLRPLHLVDVLDRLEIAAVVPRTGVRLLAAGPPEVPVTDVVIVGNRDRGRVADDFAEVPAELEPVGQMPVVVVDLIAGEEQQVGIQLLDVLDDVVFRNVSAMRRIDRVPGESRHDDDVLLDGVSADQPLVERRLAVCHSVGRVFRRVPVFDAKRGRPPRFDHFRLGDLPPSAALQDLQADGPVAVFTQRIELGRQLHDVVLNRVQRKADLLVFGHVGDRQQCRATRRTLFLLLALTANARRRGDEKQDKHNGETGFQTIHSVTFLLLVPQKPASPARRSRSRSLRGCQRDKPSDTRVF